MFNRQCLECGEAFVAKRAHGKFCCRQCNRNFNNRKAVRGVEVIDFLMNWRFGTPEAYKGRDKEAFAFLCDLASAYRQADLAERGGRRSWLTTREALEALERLPACPDYASTRRAKKDGDEPF